MRYPDEGMSDFVHGDLSTGQTPVKLHTSIFVILDEAMRNPKGSYEVPSHQLSDKGVNVRQRWLADKTGSSDKLKHKTKHHG